MSSPFLTFLKLESLKSEVTQFAANSISFSSSELYDLTSLETSFDFLIGFGLFYFGLLLLLELLLLELDLFLSLLLLLLFEDFELFCPSLALLNSSLSEELVISTYFPSLFFIDSLQFSNIFMILLNSSSLFSEPFIDSSALCTMT